MTEALGLAILMLAYIAIKLLAIPAFIATYMALAIVVMCILAAGIVAVALACRGVDKIRDRYGFETANAPSLHSDMPRGRG